MKTRRIYPPETTWADEKDRIRKDMRREKIGTIIAIICVIAIAALIIP